MPSLIIKKCKTIGFHAVNDLLLKQIQVQNGKEMTHKQHLNLVSVRLLQ